MCQKKTKSRLFGKWYFHCNMVLTRWLEAKLSRSANSNSISWTHFGHSLADEVSTTCTYCMLLHHYTTVPNPTFQFSQWCTLENKACYCVKVLLVLVIIFILMIRFVWPNHPQRRVFTQIKERKCVQHINVPSPYCINKPQKRSEGPNLFLTKGWWFLINK